MVDRSIDPTADQVRRLRDHGPEGPVTMVNLLKFRDTADYSEGSGHAACSGREAYARYQRAFTLSVGKISQAEIVYEGSVNQTVIADPASAADWDKVLIVRYPSRQHFLAMMANEEYKEALVHRYAGLERTILLQCN